MNERQTSRQILFAAKTLPETTSLARQIAALDTQIDRLVYDLHDLADAEIKIVEAGA